jgi:hypothetical protein
MIEYTIALILAGLGLMTFQQGPTITGVVKTEAGRAVQDVMVQGCTTTVCLVARTDAGGRFSIIGLKPPVRVAVKTQQDDRGAQLHAEAIVPLHLVDNSPVDVGTLYMPALPRPITLAAADAQTITLPDGLALTLRRYDLKVPVTAADEDKISARRIPAKQLPRFFDLGSERILAVYALYPFGAKSSSRIAVRMKTTLPSGTKVNLRTIHEIDGTLSQPQTATSNGKFLTSDPGTGIVNLTWLIMSR